MTNFTTSCRLSIRGGRTTGWKRYGNVTRAGHKRDRCVTARRGRIYPYGPMHPWCGPLLSGERVLPRLSAEPSLLLLGRQVWRALRTKGALVHVAGFSSASRNVCETEVKRFRSPSATLLDSRLTQPSHHRLLLNLTHTIRAAFREAWAAAKPSMPAYPRFAT
jgi:hypothetical protein